MTPSLNLVEQTAALAGPLRIDRVACVVRDVKVLGRTSRNKKVYSDQALSDLCRLAENAMVYVNHPDPKYAGRQAPRNVEDRFGRLVGLHRKPDGVYARELRYNPRHPVAEQFLWEAANNAAGVGLSLNGHSTSFKHLGDGKVLVEAISQVFSVDLVDTPAAVGSLFESYTPTVPGRSLAEVKAGLFDRPADRPPGWLLDSIQDELLGVDDRDFADRDEARRLACRLFPAPAAGPDLSRIKRALIG